MKTGTLAAGAALALGLAFGLSTARAGTITYTASGTVTDGKLSASADFTMNAGQLTVVLTNTLLASDIRSAGQALSGITFTLSNPAGTDTANTASGQLGNVSTSKGSSGGTVTYASSGTPERFIGNPSGSGSFTVSGSTITLEAIGGGKPNEMILPYVSDGGIYTDANTGFDNFNPYTIGPATFTLTLSGITADTTVTAATFSFGTKPDYSLTGTQSPPAPPPTPAPEPASLALLGTALAGLGLIGRRRLKI